MIWQEQLQWLAEQEKPCPNCQGYDASLRSQGLSHNPQTSLPLCTVCNERGTVARFPTLRQDCPGSVWSDEPHGYLEYTEGRCKVCQGRGWVVVDTLETKVEALADLGFDLRLHRHLGRWEPGLYQSIVLVAHGYRPIPWGDAEDADTQNEAAGNALYKVAQEVISEPG